MGIARSPVSDRYGQRGYHAVADRRQLDETLLAVLLQQIQDEGAVAISGAPLQAVRETKELPLKALESNVLCKRHNSSLSDLDKLAGKFFGKLKQYER